MDRIKNEQMNEESRDQEKSDSSDVSQDEGGWEDNDPDEDIIYVK